MDKTRGSKTAPLFLATLLFLLVLSGCKHGEPDRLASLENINQEITRSLDWQQIVTNSPFQLGEKTIKGDWNTPDGSGEDYYEMKFGTYPSIDGSTVAVPMAVEFARQHLHFSDDDANNFAWFSTTHYAYENLIMQKANTFSMLRGDEAIFMDDSHPVDLIIVTEPSDDEIDLARQQNVTLVQKPVCYDAFVFITHKNNPVDSLTVEQIRDIYSGNITNWKDIGGIDAQIIPYQREVNSGSQTAMINLVMQDIPMLAPETVTVGGGMGPLVEAVAEYQNDKTSIGYTYKYYIDTLYKNENIKTLKINDIPSDEENIRAGTYPFATCYYSIVRDDTDNSVAKQFLDWMLSEEGQKCIKQAGYIPYANIE